MKTLVDSCLLLLFLVTAPIVSWEAHATDVNIPNLAEVVRDSDRIARIRINARRGATLQHGGSEYDCGLIYSARVIESLKGGEEDFLFLSGDERDFAGYDVDYLVFLMDAKKLSIPEDESLRGKALCRVKSAPYVTTGQLQVMIPFRGADETKGVEETLQISRISAVSILPVREVDIGDARYGLIEWQAAKAAIANELDDRENAISESRERASQCLATRRSGVSENVHESDVQSLAARPRLLGNE